MADNMYAGASIQVFPNGDSDLTTPHGDVADFLDYVGQFNTVNFHARDDDVREWRYNHEYDNWQDRLGIDSVRVFYHNGHSTTQANGDFIASLGRTWDDTFFARSSRMSPGDHRLRYLFWASCNSVRVSGGQNPFRTWNRANKGLRMIFGFDSLSWDEPGYASGFFREWNAGKSFSQAWIDGSLAIRTDQRPAIAACGATAEEAQDRLWNERLFYGARVSDDWYWWRWAGQPVIEIVLVISVPRGPNLLQLARRSFDADTAARLAERWSVRPILSSPNDPRQQRRTRAVLGEPRLVLARDGSYRIHLAEPDRTADACGPELAVAAAHRAIENLDRETELEFEGLTTTQHSGASRRGEETRPRMDGYTAHFRQRVDGERMVSGRDGRISLSLDPAGKLCAISDSTIPVAAQLEARPTEECERGLEERLDEAVKAELHRLEAAGAQVALVPNGRDFGYSVRGDVAVTVARQDIEITTGEFTKRRTLEIVW
jgi:hypothetical protein